jgi:hypothetical protein
MWEYKVVVIEWQENRYYTDSVDDAKKGAAVQERELNKYGDWELIKIITMQIEGCVVILAYLKRQKVN